MLVDWSPKSAVPERSYESFWLNEAFSLDRERHEKRGEMGRYQLAPMKVFPGMSPHKYFARNFQATSPRHSWPPSNSS